MSDPNLQSVNSGDAADGVRAGRLEEVALSQGEPFAGGANRPIRLDDPETAWFVTRGAVDVFVACEQDDGNYAEFNHLLRATRGRLLFQANDRTNVLLAKGLPESELVCVPRDALFEAGAEEEIVAQVDLWVADVSASVARDVTHRPPVRRFLDAGDVLDLEGGDIVSTKHGVAWTSTEDGGPTFLGTEEPDPNGSRFVPVAPGSWISVAGSARLTASSSNDLARKGKLLQALAEFHRLALGADDLNRSLLAADALNLQTSQQRHRRRSEDAARRKLFEVLNAPGHRREDRRPDQDSELLEALAPIGRHEGIDFRPPRGRRRSEGRSVTHTLREILNASGVRSRKVALKTRERWWRSDSGALLAFRREDGAPVALVPGALGRYRLVDPVSGRARDVNAAEAEALEPKAVFFYQPLPRGASTDAGALVRIALRHWKGDVARFLLSGMLAGLTALAPAVVLGVFADQVAPSGSIAALEWLVVGTLLLGLVAALLSALEGTALMRIEGRAAARVTSALWDRLLDLPPAFFRNFAAGDLATRVMAFQQLRDQLAGVILGALLSTVFLLPTFVLLFLYDELIGWLGLALGLGSLTVTVSLGLRQVPHQRRWLTADRSLASLLLQLITAAPKLRSAGKEWTAFTQWAEGYRDQKDSEMKTGALNEHLVAFTTAAPLLATAALFAVALRTTPEPLSPGAFLAVYAAFLVFMTAVASLGRSASGVAAIVPAGQQVAPILKASPRSTSANISAPELRGELRLENVSFRYTEDGPLVLSEIDIKAEAGEFVALVGASGAGKSTVLRLALGLEKPISGVVYYDGHDLDRLNRRAIRQHVGMVIQDVALQPFTVQDSIIGVAADDLTPEDAWNAARLAAVDEDIRAMPMGMDTQVGESASVFSGGQIQRIMLASALVRQPRVLLLDEATNWLDNTTQTEVMDRIERLAITRIVSAHRLSTIRMADRIYVLEDGRVVQSGTFEQLMNRDGLFRNLASRQIA